MAVSLSKRGDRVSLAKVAIEAGITTALQKLAVGLAWKPRLSGGVDFDLDASLFQVDANDKTTDEGFIFYGTPKQNGDTNHKTGQPFFSKDGSIHHSGDNRKGDASGDDEIITIDLLKVPDNIVKLAVVITIDSADEKGQNFGQVDNAVATVYDATSGQLVPMTKFDMTENNSRDTAMHVCDIYRSTPGAQDWKFNPAGVGSPTGLKALCEYFGLTVE